MGDFAEGDVVFELGDVVSKQKVLCDRSGGKPYNESYPILAIFLY